MIPPTSRYSLVASSYRSSDTCEAYLHTLPVRQGAWTASGNNACAPAASGEAVRQQRHCVAARCTRPADARPERNVHRVTRRAHGQANGHCQRLRFGLTEVEVTAGPEPSQPNVRGASPRARKRAAEASSRARASPGPAASAKCDPQQRPKTRRAPGRSRGLICWVGLANAEDQTCNQPCGGTGGI